MTRYKIKRRLTWSTKQRSFTTHCSHCNETIYIKGGAHGMYPIFHNKSDRKYHMCKGFIHDLRDPPKFLIDLHRRLYDQ